MENDRKYDRNEKTGQWERRKEEVPSNSGKPKDKNSNSRGKGKSGKNNGYKGKNRGNNRGRKDNSRSEFFGPSNDLSWYNRYPQLLAAAANIPYPYRPGMDITLYSSATTNNTLPGVMTLDWLPSIGKANYATDPANVAAKEIYAKVRSVFSGSLDADAPDFMVYLMALDSIFSYIAYLKRIYRIIDAWSPNNYVTPNGLLTAMNITSSEIQVLRRKKVKLWQNINELVLQSRKFTCPAEMDIFNRHYWLSDNVYTDAPSVNSQFYLFNLVGVYAYLDTPIPSDATTTASGLAISFIRPGWNSASGSDIVEKMFEFGLSLIQRLVAWDDAYTINGYLKKAYEGVSQFVIDELPVNQPFSPVYVPEVLQQIENSRCIPCGNAFIFSPTATGSGGLYTGFTVAQEPSQNALISNPKFTIPTGIDSYGEVSGYGYLANHCINIRNDAPSAVDTVIATRLHSHCTVSGTTVNISAGTEIPLCWRISGQPDTYLPQTPTFTQTTTITTDQYTQAMRWVRKSAQLENFDWHPFVLSLITTTATSSVEANLSGDIWNITTLTADTLLNLHRVCLYSEFNAFAF